MKKVLFIFLYSQNNKKAVAFYQLYSRMVHVSFTVDIGQNFPCFFHASLVSEPARREGERPHASKQNDGRDSLDRPWDSPRSAALYVLATVLDPETKCVWIRFKHYVLEKKIE